MGQHKSIPAFAIIAVMSWCHDIMCKSILGSPTPFLFFGRVKGEPGNEARAYQCPLCGVERYLLLGGSKCISSMVKSTGGK